MYVALETLFLRYLEIKCFALIYFYLFITKLHVVNEFDYDFTYESRYLIYLTKNKICSFKITNYGVDDNMSKPEVVINMIKEGKYILCSFD